MVRPEKKADSVDYGIKHFWGRTMLSTSNARVPSYCKHKATRQAVVRINGKDHYLGRYGTEASKRRYDRLINEWLAHGRQLPNSDGDAGASVNSLLLAYLQHAEGHYRRPDGSPTSELSLLKLALRPLKKLYGMTSATEFRPSRLKAVRQEMIESGLSRNTINKHIGRIKQVFRWGVENEFLPPAVYQGLQAVRGLTRGRSEARETEPVRPVPEGAIVAVKPLVSTQVAALIDLQLLTGARPGELCVMRRGDLDMTGAIWVYRPHGHKTAHHGHDREIFIGPAAQGVLRGLLKTDLQAYLFSARDAREERYRIMRAKRKTQVQPSQQSRRQRRPKRTPGDHYDVASYRRAIKYACDRAFPLPEDLAKCRGENKAQWLSRLTDEQKAEVVAWRRKHHWHPHQLRHNAGTRLRKEFGVELARIILGHRSLIATQIYAESDRAAAIAAIEKVG